MFRRAEGGVLRWARRTLLVLAAAAALSAPALADVGIVEKRTFTMPAYTTEGGQTIRDVRIGWEAYGRLNEARDNAILITHFFSGTSNAAGRYSADQRVPGYWDAIIGPGKAIDTDRFYVISSDTLVNLNAKDPNVVTTGPASIDPATGRPYGMSFPLVTIRDFVNVQKALVESLGITRLHAVVGASMGALQAFEWAASYPEMVGRVVPVIGGAEADAFLIGWLNIWAAPIRLDPAWNGGDYHGREEPTRGLTEALKIVTLQARAWQWADAAAGRRWAAEGRDPRASMDNLYAIEAMLDAGAAGRAAVSDANHFLYLVKANQTFAAGNGMTAEQGLRRITAPVLMISSAGDLVFMPDRHGRALEGTLRSFGVEARNVETITGTLGHLDGVANMAPAADTLKAFLGR